MSYNNSVAKLNPFRYRGYYYDCEIGLYFLKSRYYDPEVGRFLNRDSIIFADPEEVNGLNLYAYCLNNPINYIDPLGKFVISIGAALVMLAGGLFASFAAPIIVDATGDIADQIVSSIESLNIPDTIEGSTIGSIDSSIDSVETITKNSTITTASFISKSIFVEAEHTANARKSTKNKHEEGKRKKKMNRPGGEKGDARRPFRRGGKHTNLMLVELYYLLLLF